jgi:hypothetical protein
LDSGIWRTNKTVNASDYMTEDELLEAKCVIDTLNYNKSAMNDHITEWEQIEEMYTNEKTSNIIESDTPNTKMNRLVSVVEGMVSQLVDNNISITTRGQGPEDEAFAEDARIGLSWAFRQNNVKHKFSLHERRRLKFGGAWIKVVHDKHYAGGYGLSKIQMPSNTKVYVDRKIRDYFRLDEADYVAESIRMSRSSAIRTYGKDKACLIDYGVNEFFDSGVFSEAFDLPDDCDSWILLQYWSKEDGILRLREFSACGILLFDSFKGMDRKENQKDKEIIPKSYYKHVYDEYPYFYTPKYTIEGDFHGFGEGRLMLPIQKMINELYDKIRIMMRPHMILIDAYSDINVEDFDDNSFTPKYFDGAKTQGRQPVHHVPWGHITSDIFQLLEQINIDMQRVVRFSDLMLGQAKAADTATEAAIQQQQGNAHTSHEKTMFENTLSNVAKYMLGLMIEFNEGGMSLRINEEDDDGEMERESDYSWIDFNDMAEIPAQMPATKSYRDEFKSRNPQAPEPKYEIVTKNGVTQTKSICLDIDISVGSALPKNPAFLWQMIERLSQMLVVDTDEAQPTPKPAISWNELREFMVTILGIPIKQSDQMKEFVERYQQMQAAQMQQQRAQMGGGGQPMDGGGQMPDAMTQGMGAGGGVMQPSAEGTAPEGPMGAGQGPMG